MRANALDRRYPSTGYLSLTAASFDADGILKRRHSRCWPYWEVFAEPLPDRSGNRFGTSDFDITLPPFFIPHAMGPEDSRGLRRP